jgi:hypothetical protein
MVNEWLIFTTTPFHFYKFDAEIDGKKIQINGYEPQSPEYLGRGINLNTSTPVPFSLRRRGAGDEVNRFN